jgi:hypothetical protein
MAWIALKRAELEKCIEVCFTLAMKSTSLDVFVKFKFNHRGHLVTHFVNGCWPILNLIFRSYDMIEWVNATANVVENYLM